MIGMGVSATFFGSCSAPVARSTSPMPAKAAKLVRAARAQIGVTLNYDPAYTDIPFPGGDVPRILGVCTDVVIRAYRDALGLDLQQLVNADMRAHFSEYPTRWGLDVPDSNIDHRRVLNLERYFERQGASLPHKNWKAGDIVSTRVNNNLPHIGILSDRNAGNHPLFIHNIGRGTQEEDIVFDQKIIGHYRWNLG